ncbi:MAG: glycosyltransferase family 9 protein [Betaproteobacteria bacterium]|nr:glycosyltransferase family 9 protein [Betaproteobacteria bacterium]
MKVGVFNTAFVGDLALMGKLIDALHLGGHEVVLFSNAPGCALYEYDSRIAKRVTIKKQKGLRKARAVFSIARQIRRESLDVLLLAHKSFTSGIVALRSGVPRVFSFSDASFSQAWSERVKVSTHLHESDRYAQLACALVDEPSLVRAEFNLVGDLRLQTFLGRFPDFFERIGQRFFICSPGSVWYTKRYPSALQAHLLVQLMSQRRALTCVLSGGPSDFAAMDEVLGELRLRAPDLLALGRIVDARSCLPLPELVELTRRAEFVLTPDSAPLHIASATKTKVFAFFGPTSAVTGFGPAREDALVIDHTLIRGAALPCQPCSKHGHRKCPLSHHRCLADLQPDAIADRMLDSIAP